MSTISDVLKLPALGQPGDTFLETALGAFMADFNPRFSIAASDISLDETPFFRRLSADVVLEIQDGMRDSHTVVRLAFDGIPFALVRRSCKDDDDDEYASKWTTVLTSRSVAERMADGLVLALAKSPMEESAGSDDAAGFLDFGPFVKTDAVSGTLTRLSAERLAAVSWRNSDESAVMLRRNDGTIMIFLDNDENPFFSDNIAAAAELFHTIMVKKSVLSSRPRDLWFLNVYGETVENVAAMWSADGTALCSIIEEQRKPVPLAEGNEEAREMFLDTADRLLGKMVQFRVPGFEHIRPECRFR